jgi:ribose 5-phosphate isomerase A
LSLATGRLTALELRPEQRMQDGKAYLTDNGNYILDCGTGPIDEPEALEREILSIPGIVGTGLFLNMAETVLVEGPSGVDERHRSRN